MGRKSKAGRPSKEQRQQRQIMSEWKAEYKEIEKRYARHMMPVAVEEAFLLALQVGGTILHDYFGFGKTRLNRWAEKTIDWYDSVLRDYVTIDKICDDFTRLTGCTYSLTAQDVETLEEYGMKGLVEEIRMTNEQINYLRDRAANGWQSTTNRYGKEVIGQ